MASRGYPIHMTSRAAPIRVGDVTPNNRGVEQSGSSSGS